MTRTIVSILFIMLLAAGWMLSLDAPLRAAAASMLSGQGDLQFKVLYTSSHCLPMPSRFSKRLMADSPSTAGQARARPTSPSRRGNHRD